MSSANEIAHTLAGNLIFRLAKLTCVVFQEEKYYMLEDSKKISTSVYASTVYNPMLKTFYVYVIFYKICIKRNA